MSASFDMSGREKAHEREKSIMMMPKELNHPSFYNNGHSPQFLFPEEFQFYSNHGKGEKERPWLNFDQELTRLKDEWKELESQLRNLFQERKGREAVRYVFQGCACFLKFLFWSNEKPVNLHLLAEEIQQLEIKPMNVSERIQFILNNPKLHHSFLQLQQLFIEQEKVYAKHKIIRKRASE